MPTPKAANIHNFIKPYVVVSGKKFILKDHDPGDMHHLNSEDKPEAKRLVEESVDAGGTSRSSLRAIQLGVAADFSGHGCRGKRQHDQACDVRCEPAGRGCLFLQASFE